MNKQSITILVLSSIITALLVYVIFFDKTKVQYVDKYANQKSSIDSLTNEIKDLQKQQLAQDSVIADYQSRIDYYKGETKKVDKKIETIRTEYENKIRDVSNHTPIQLDSFFTKRYK